MKILKITFSVFLISMIFAIGLKIYRDFNINRVFKNEEKNKLKKAAEVLNECFDLKNKSQRTVNASMKLIEFCLEEYDSVK